MNETLQEFVDSRGVAVRVDRTKGVIRGVKILGLKSRNGRRYLPEALDRAARLYEGAKVNVNHPKGSPTAPRDYQDRIGVIRNVTARAEEGLFADLFFNPKHALAEQLVWDAEHAPENVGFSHNVEARTCRRGDEVVVEAIMRVQSVDLVADPATTRGLFESQTDGEDGQRPVLEALDLEQFKALRPDLVATLLDEPTRRIGLLEAELRRLRLSEADARRQLLVRRLLAEFHLPDPDADDAASRAIIGPRFLEALRDAADERTVRELIEERATLVREIEGSPRRTPAGNGKPRSVDPIRLEAARDVKSFVEAIT